MILAAACGGGRDSAEKSTRADSSITSYAWKLRNDGAPSDTLIAVQRRAVEQLRRGESPDDPVAVLEQMGMFYCIIGDYDEAISYYLEASDTLRAHPERPRSEGAIQLFGDLGVLYGQLGLMEEAFEYNDSALAESRRQGGVMMSDLYQFRSVFYQQQDNSEEAGRCYDLALKAINEGRTNADKDLLRALVGGERGYFLLETYKDRPDSVNRAVRLLETALKYESSDTAARYFSLGLGYSLQGRHELGLSMMEKMCDEFRRQEDLEMLNYALTSYMAECARLKRWDKVGQIFPEQNEVFEIMRKLKAEQSTIGAGIRYKSQLQHERNEQLLMQLAHARSERRMAWAIAVLAAMVFAFIVTSVWKRYRRVRRHNEQQSRRIMELSDSHAMVLDRVQSLEANLSAKINSNVEILSTPRLIVGEEQGAFRRAFNVLYPRYIPELHRDYPLLTTNDDLLCMLIYLRHTTEEVAVYLGISRASVNSARYRLRRKFALDNSMDLDEFLTSRPG